MRKLLTTAAVICTLASPATAEEGNGYLECAAVYLATTTVAKHQGLDQLAEKMEGSHKVALVHSEQAYGPLTEKRNEYMLSVAEGWISKGSPDQLSQAIRVCDAAVWPQNK